MTAMKNHARKSQDAPARRRKYTKTTPVIRLRRNVEKIGRHAELGRERLLAWKSDDPDVAAALALTEKIEADARDLVGRVVALEKKGFCPTRHYNVWAPAVGEVVRITEEYRSKYEAIYASVLESDSRMLDELVVHSTLPTGEIVVQRNKKTPFAVRKSHLAPVSVGD
ncbi:MAG TPA: hypothetical protein DCX12_02745 [Chloroflexi bacterium]|nr:hypothetical protein [Chloroflexota bacterium]